MMVPAKLFAAARASVCSARLNLTTITAALFGLILSTSAFGQSSPGFTYGQVPTTAQWNAAFAAKQDTLGFTPVNRAGDTMVGRLRTAASQAASAGFSIYPGTAPTSPNNGDVWITSTGLYARVNNATIGPISAATGSVTSVGLSAPSFLAVTNSPVTTSGTLTLSLASQTQNRVFASPNGSSGAPTFRSLVGADLPSPSATTLGGIQSFSAVTSNWIRSISTSGVPAASQPNFTDLAGSIATGQIPANVVTNSQLSQVSTSTFKGRTTAGTGNVEDLTSTQATAQLNAMVGDSGSGGTKGLAPAPASGDTAAGKYLKADGTWQVPPGGITASSTATLTSTSTNITGIPATAKLVTIMVESLSLTGTANPLIQLRTASGVEVTGYLANSGIITGTNTTQVGAFTAGFGIAANTAANTYTGVLTLALQNPATNRWVLGGSMGLNNAAATVSMAGVKSLAGALTGITFTSSNGTDTFDSGTVSILYQ